MARAGIVLGAINLCITAILLAALPMVIIEVRRNALRAACAMHLRTLGQALMLYSNDNRGLLPPTLDCLISSGNVPAGDPLFTCPQCRRDGSKKPATVGPLVMSDYMYPSPPSRIRPELMKYMGDAPYGIVIAWEPLASHQGRGMHVLLRRGNVLWLEGVKATKVEGELRAGFNPPPTLDPHGAAWSVQPATTSPVK